MIIKAPYIISLALTPNELWEPAGLLSSSEFAVELWLMQFKVIILVISALLVLIATVKLEHSERRLKRTIADLTTSNKKLQQEIDELKIEQTDVLESIIEAEPPGRKIPGFNPQELKALSELANRLR